MICPTCGVRERSIGQFCAECGTRLALVCPTCGSPVAASAKFCAECGTNLRAGCRGGADGPRRARCGNGSAGRRPAAPRRRRRRTGGRRADRRAPPRQRPLRRPRRIHDRRRVARPGGRPRAPDALLRRRPRGRRPLRRHRREVHRRRRHGRLGHARRPRGRRRTGRPGGAGPRRRAFARSRRPNRHRAPAAGRRHDRRGCRHRRGAGPGHGRRRHRQHRRAAPGHRAARHRARGRGHLSRGARGASRSSRPASTCSRARPRASRRGSPCASSRSAAAPVDPRSSEPPFVGRDVEFRLLKDLLARDDHGRAGAARVDRRPGGHRQEPPRVGVPEIRRRPRRGRLLAPGPLAGLRRGDQLLGARRDGPRRGPGLETDDPETTRREARGVGRRVHPRSRPIASWVAAGARRASSAWTTAGPAAARSCSRPGGATSRRSPPRARRCWCSRTSSGPTRACSTSSRASSSGRAHSRS